MDRQAMSSGLQTVLCHNSDGFVLRLHVQPNASKTEFTGLHGDRLKIRLQAKPKDGAANIALCRFVAKTAGVSQSRVKLIRGSTSREKDLQIQCDEADATAQKFSKYCKISD